MTLLIVLSNMLPPVSASCRHVTPVGSSVRFARPGDLMAINGIARNRDYGDEQRWRSSTLFSNRRAGGVAAASDQPIVIRTGA
jgi:hypothetical protein